MSIESSPDSAVPRRARQRTPRPRPNELLRWFAALGLLPIATLGCGQIVLGEEKDSCELAVPQSKKLFVHAVTFWTDGPEAEALKILKNKLKEEGGDLTPTTKDNRTDLQNGLFVSGEEPPDVYQVNGGSDVLQFALEGGSSTKICPLDTLYDLYDLERHYFEAAWKPSMCHGSHYAIPLNVHRVNTLMVNSDLYAVAREKAREEGEAIPLITDMKSAEELVSILEQIAKWGLEVDGETVVPVSIGIGSIVRDERTLTNTWPLTILAYESLLASYPGRAYESLWQGEGPVADIAANLDQLADHMERLGAISNILEGLDWQEATNRVIHGRALLTINGDWIFAGALTKSSSVEMLVFPNSQHNFVYTPDSFAVPRLKGKTGEHAHGWFRDVTDDTDTQLRFARQKWAIPAKRGLTDLGELGSDYLEKSYAEFSDCQPDETGEAAEGCRLLLAVSGLAPGGGHDPCFDRTGALLAMIAGVKYDDQDWGIFAESSRRECERPAPRDALEAKAQLRDVLEGVSAHPFAESCRTE